MQGDKYTSRQSVFCLKVLKQLLKYSAFNICFQLTCRSTLELGLCCDLNKSSWSLLQNHPQFRHPPLLLTLPAFPLVTSGVEEHLLELDLITLLVFLLSLHYLSFFNHTENTSKQPVIFHLGYGRYIFSGYNGIFIAKKYIKKENLLRLTVSSSHTHLKWETLQQDSSAGTEWRLQHQIYIT